MPRADAGKSPRSPEARVLDAASLKGLAHPLRQELLDALLAFGPATATQLAERLAESSGATSYHLRQLERHGFVEVDPGRGDGREKFWRAVRRSIVVDPDDSASPATRIASQRLLVQWHQSRSRQILDYILSDDSASGGVWASAPLLSSAYLQLTVDELADVSAEISHTVRTIVDKYRNRTPDPDSERRSVLVNTAAIPIRDEQTS